MEIMAHYFTDAEGNLIKIAGNCNGEKIEEIYNKSSTDSSINWGYTSGIANSVEVTGRDFSKYKKLICYSHIANGVNGIFEIDLTKQVLSNNGYQGGNVINYGYETSSNHYLFISAGLVNTNKTSIKASVFLKYLTNGTTYTSSTSYFIYKIEGVY